MSDALCVGAHPDDVELGMGAAIACMVDRGLSVTICDLTDGEPTPRGTREIRMQEAARAARVLGAERVTLSQPNRYLMDTVEARTELAEVIRAERPRLLFAPFPLDAHPDHIAASAIVAAARFYAKFTKTDMSGEPFYPPKLYRYMAVHLRLNRRPSFIVDVSEGLERKLAAVAEYDSQFGNERGAAMLDGMRTQAAWWGSLIGAAAGEAFFSEEEIGVSSFDALL